MNPDPVTLDDSLFDEIADELAAIPRPRTIPHTFWDECSTEPVSP